MKKIMILCLCIVLAVSSASAESQEEPDQIIEVFRHGARVVLGDYDPSWPSNEYGELTPVGMRQHYILGRALAKKYPHLLGSNYNYSQVYVLSDTTPRCIQSAMSQLYGIYLGSGPSLNSTYPPELAVPPYQDPFVQELAMSLGDSAALPHGYVPAIVQIVDASNGFTFSSDGSTFCPNDNLWTDQNLNSSKLTSGMLPFNTTIQNINAYFNNSLTISDLSDVWDEIEVDLIENRTNPAGIENPELISNFTFAASWLSMYTYMNQKVQRQVASFGLVTAIITQLTNFRQGETFNNVALYSGHDGDIWAILGAFGVVTEECLLANFESYVANGTTPYANCYYPGFAANLIFEFYNSTDAPYVKLYYNNVIVPLCNGKDACSYDEFISFANNAIGNRTVQDYFQKCGTNMTYVSEYYAPKIELISQERIIAPRFNLRTEILVIIGLVILCSILLVKIITDQKRYNKKFNDLMHQSMLYDEDNNVRLQ